MTVTQAISLQPAELKDAATRLLATGGRMQMVYAWYPEPDRLELRYTGSPPANAPFAIWRCDAKEPVPSLAGVSPLLSWYEREITDLFGLRFLDHPQPHRLVLHEGVDSNKPPFAPDYPPDRPLLVQRTRSAVPELAGAEADVQLLPFGPVRADVVESGEFLFFYVGEAILHYHPRLFFKHRGMEKRFEGLEPARGIVLAERVSGVGSVAHALAYCQAVEAASNCIVPARARYLRVLLAEMERLYNHLHYFGHLCHTTTLKVGEAEG
ncbi:MAG: NADH-quinone oxidoreductase subunit C, partial [Xanthobacteraceae bacterium]